MVLILLHCRKELKVINISYGVFIVLIRFILRMEKKSVNNLDFALLINSF